MQKLEARDWVSLTEAAVDKKLVPIWLKENPVDNGELMERRWTFGQTHIHLKVFWPDGKETIQLLYLSPRGSHDFIWHGLDEKSFDHIMDRVGNLAQVTMHPPTDPDIDG